MDEKLIEDEVDYQIVKTLLFTLLNKGRITRKEYNEANRELQRHYEPFIESLRGEDIWENGK